MTSWFAGLSESEDQLLIQLKKADGSAIDLWIDDEIIPAEGLEIPLMVPGREIPVSEHIVHSVKELRELLR